MLSYASKNNDNIGQAVSKSAVIHRQIAAWMLASQVVKDASEALIETHRLNKYARASDIIVINKNTGSCRDYRCTVCGWVGGGHCATFPRTVRSISETDDHMLEEISEVEKLSKLFKPDYSAANLFVR